MSNLQFEVKFFSSDKEATFPATATFQDVLHYINAFYFKVTLKYIIDGFNVLSEGEHIGTIKPCYPNDNKVAWLHSLLK